MIDRRGLLGAAGAMTLASSGAMAAAGDPFNPDRLQADVLRYAGFGIHETGGAGDRATCAWADERLRAAGFTLSGQPIDVPFFTPRKTALETGDLRVAGLALRPAVVTGPEGITAPLHMRYDPADDGMLAGRIVVIPLPYGRHSTAMSPVIAPALTVAKHGGAAGIVIITTGPSALPIALNAPEDAPFAGLPILLVGLDQAPALIARARAGDRATLTLDGATGQRRGNNVIAHRPGAGRSVVITTPLSGWFRCAAERGSGIAVWLAFAEWLPRTFPHLDLTFAGLVGHELENVGAERFLTEAAPKPERVVLWQHFGAGLAARDWQETIPGHLTPLPSADTQRYLLASPDLLPIVQRATRGLSGYEKVYPGDARNAAGEATGILKAGYTRVVANFAGHRFHHTEGDGPDAVTGPLIADAACAFQRAASAILAKT